MKNIMCGYDKFCLSHKVIESFLVLSALSGLLLCVVDAENKTVFQLLGPVDKIANKSVIYAEKLYQYYLNPEANPRLAHYSQTTFMQEEEGLIYAVLKTLRHMYLNKKDPNFRAVHNAHKYFIQLYDLKKLTKEKQLELIRKVIDKLKEMKAVLETSTVIYTRDPDISLLDMN
uniref:Uncharacterized protein n=1 Tax=Clastoptera arizonana TaxID=38151 RepID=A0A1B6DAD8_9HEMI